MNTSPACGGFESFPTESCPRRPRSGGPNGNLKPCDNLSLLFILSHGKDPEIKAAALKTLSEFPEKDLLQALEEDLDPLVVEKAASLHPGSVAVLEKIISHRSVNDTTLEKMAIDAPSEIA